MNWIDGTTTRGTSADDVRSTFAYDVLGELIGYCPAAQVMASGCLPDKEVLERRANNGRRR